MSGIKFRQIAVATDGSEHAKVAVDVAIDLAGRYGSELTIVSVAPLAPVFVSANEPFIPPPVPTSSLPRFREIVDSAVAEARAAGVPGVTGVCEEGAVVEEILEHLKNHPTDLLVVGSRGLSTAKRLLLGSVSTALVTHAPVPVLVVRATATSPEA